VTRMCWLAQSRQNHLRDVGGVDHSAEATRPLVCSVVYDGMTIENSGPQRGRL